MSKKPRALVIIPNEKTQDLGDLLAIARAEAQKREHTHENVNVKSLSFIPECGVYVAVYERCSNKPDVRRRKRGDT